MTLLNINDNAPAFINTLDSGSGIKNITETTPKDTSIYRIEAEDADGDAVSIDLVAQIPAGMFTFDGTTLWTTDVFDYETGQFILLAQFILHLHLSEFINIL